ncbi:NAD(P)H-binding protein [Salinicoccus sp. HZC-1]|uniref:NAD(P)H-binding protein n=1 Tax=Salinicoccus sp. HZC-1 TaxID=3385497 RepID=UPI00398BA7B3
MKVFVFGGNEGAGEHVLKKLAEKDHEIVTIAETENRAEELKMLGATDVIISKDKGIASAIEGSEAIIYMAGSSLGAGEDQETLVDYGTVRKSLEEAQRQKIERVVYLSPVRTDESEESKETGEKDEPEEWIKKNELVYTVIRTAKRVSKPGKGMITAEETIAAGNDEIPYEDVAAVLVEALDNQNTFKKAFDITAGDTSIKEALDSL